MIRAQGCPAHPTPNPVPEASPTKAPIARQTRSVEPADVLPMDIWESVIGRLPPREQALVASSHSAWRDVCRQPRWAMHRARLNHELQRCDGPADIIPVLGRHRHVLPYLDTLVLQPALKQRCDAAVAMDADFHAIFEAAPAGSEIHPILDWLADASDRHFKIWVVCKASFLMMVLINGSDKRHPALSDDFSHHPQNGVDTPAKMLAIMPQLKSDSRVIWRSEIDDRHHRVWTEPKFWKTYVECYPNVESLSLTREVFEASGKRLDEICNMQHLQKLSVPRIRAEELPPGLRKRHDDGRLRISAPPPRIAI